MTREQIRQAVRGYVKALLSLPDAQVLKAETAGTIPAGTDAYVTVLVIGGSGVTTQTVAVAASGGGMAKRVSSQRRVRVSLNGYGSDAEEWMSRLADVWPTTHPTMDAVRAAGLTPSVRPTEPRQINDRTGRYPFPRYQVDLIGYHRRTEADAAVDSFTSIEVTDRIGGLTNTYTVEQ